MRIAYFLLFVQLIFPTEYYYFHPENQRGSELFFHPINTVLNGSFDILRNGTYSSKNLLDVPYKGSFENIWFNITHPIENVEKFGVDKFVELEIFNLSFDPSKGHFLPNIANHVLGNGMLYVKMAEWYDYHNYTYPKLWSFTTTTIYQVMNEVIEHPSGKQYINVDSISDLLIFNPLGFILFSFDRVNTIFTQTLPIYDWSLQPMIDFNSSTFENTGQNYIMHIHPLGNQSISPFIYWGIHGIAGISYKHENGNMYSLGAGRMVNRIRSEIRETDYLEDTIFFTPDMDGALSFFYSHNGSLLASVMVTGPRFYNAQCNIFPGVIKLGEYSPGLYVSFGESEGFELGLSFDFLPFGFGHKFK
jgi:hypothetical protein